MKVTVSAEQLKYKTPGGIATYVRGLASGLAELNEPDFQSDFYVPSIPVSVVTRLWDRGIWAIGKDSDLVHSSSLRIPTTARPLVTTVHDLLWRKYPEYFPSNGVAWHAKQLSKAKNQSIAFVVPSSQSADALIESGVSASMITTIESGCDHLPNPDDEGAKKLLNDVGVRSGYLLTVGTLEPRKNLQRVVEAWSAAREKSPNVAELVIVGAKGWGDTQELSGAKLINDVNPAQLAALYGSAAATIYAPIAEGYGLPPLESMKANTPVICSPVPSVESAAHIVDPSSVESIRDAIVELSTNESLRNQLSQSGSAYVANRTWKTAAAHHLALWKSVIK